MTSFTESRLLVLWSFGHPGHSVGVSRFDKQTGLSSIVACLPSLTYMALPHPFPGRLHDAPVP